MRVRILNFGHKVVYIYSNTAHNPITPFNYDGIRNLTVQFASDGGGTAHHCYMSSEDLTRYPSQTMPSGDRTATAGVQQDHKADIRLWVNP
jgi:hypothetical protein